MTRPEFKFIGTVVADALDYLDTVVDAEHAELVTRALKRMFITFTCLGAAMGIGIVLIFYLLITSNV